MRFPWALHIQSAFQPHTHTTRHSLSNTKRPPIHAPHARERRPHLRFRPRIQRHSYTSPIEDALVVEECVREAGEEGCCGGVEVEERAGAGDGAGNGEGGGEGDEMFVGEFFWAERGGVGLVWMRGEGCGEVGIP